MDDRELLEKAARAAGYKVAAPVEKHVAQLGHLAGGFIIDNDKGGQSCWNPLTDDGDALRLAVKLRIDICTEENDEHPAGGRQICHVNAWAHGGGMGCSEERDTDPYAATRRAIVRAAAAMGEQA